MIDFEKAVIKSFTKLFSSATIKGCLFHFSQSLWKNFQKHHLKAQYLIDTVLQDWFKSIFCLALIPIEAAEIQFISLQDLMTDELSKKPEIGSNGENFSKYVLDTYFEGYFTMKMWNHYETSDELTNNLVEGDNSKMAKFCGASNPNIFKAVDLLLQYETISVNKFYNALTPATNKLRMVRNL